MVKCSLVVHDEQRRLTLLQFFGTDMGGEALLQMEIEIFLVVGLQELRPTAEASRG